MLHTPMDILKAYPVRKSRKQKTAFRQDVREYLSRQGYEAKEEKGSFGAVNLIAGDPEKAKYLVTAHYDTCARMVIPNLITPCSPVIYWAYQIGLILLFCFVSIAVGVLTGMVWPEAGKKIAILTYWALLILMMFGPANPSNVNDNTSGVITLLEIARTLPENQREKVCFVLFDLEEAGLIGSASHRKKHKKASDSQLVLNLDCVGEGDHIRLFPTKKLKKDRKKLSSLYKGCGYFGSKSLIVQEKGWYIYPSDQANFPYGVGICALKQKKKLLYLGWIHTPKDTILEETNVNLLRAALTTLISSDAAQ